MDSIVKVKHALWKRYERERASQSANYRKKTDWLGLWKDSVDIPDLSLKIILRVSTETKTPKKYFWIIEHPSFTIETSFLPDGNAYLAVKKSLNDRKKFLPLLKAVEDAFGFDISMYPHRPENKNAEILLNALHKNKLANIKIPRNVKQLFGRADPKANNAPSIDLFSPEANAIIDALETTMHANVAIPEYWVRYHGGLYASETMYYRFKVPKDVVIITLTYPGCPNFWIDDNNWKAKGHMNAYCGNLERFPKLSSCKREKGQMPMFIPYVSGDVMPNIYLSMKDEKNKKMGLFRRRYENGRFMPVDVETPTTWLGDIVAKYGPGIYYVSSCQSVANKNDLEKIHLVKNLRNLALHAEKARKRKYAKDNYYGDVHDIYKNFFNKHISLLKKKTPTRDDIIRMRKAFLHTGMKVYRNDFTKKHVDMVWNRLHASPVRGASR